MSKAEIIGRTERSNETELKRLLARITDLTKDTTPGPWKVNKYGSIGAGPFGSEPIVASVEPFYGTDKVHGNHGANASFIAESRELLWESACKIQRLRDDLWYISQFLMRNPPEHHKDWGCTRCAPNSEIADGGFTCPYHVAVDYAGLPIPLERSDDSR